MQIFVYFLSLILVDIPWPVPKLGRTNMVFIHQYNRLNTVPLCFGIWAQVAWTYVYIEYRHPERHPNFSHISLA